MSSMPSPAKRTPPKFRHPGRTICLLDHPDSTEGIIGSVQRKLANASQIQIHVEFCAEDRPSFSLRASTDSDYKYLQKFVELKGAIHKLSCIAKESHVCLWDHIEVFGNSPSDSNTPSCSVSSRIRSLHPNLAQRSPAELRFPRIGAFEIVIFSSSDDTEKWDETLIYSKLETTKWPSISRITEWIEILTLRGNYLSISKIQRAFRAHQARQILRNLKWFSFTEFAMKLQKVLRGHFTRKSLR